MELTPNTDEAIDFLSNWDKNGPWTLVSIRPTQEKGERPHVRAASFTTLQQARAWIDGYNGSVNLYFVPNRCDTTITTSPERHHMTFVRCFHLDIDLPKDAVGTEAELEALLAKIRMFNPYPHVILFSGGGFQCFWLWEEEKPSTDYTERVEADNKAILKQVGGDGSCWNVNRLMRLPGTVNVLNYIKRQRGRVPALARVVESRWDLPRWRMGKDPVPSVPIDEAADAPTLDPQEGNDAQPQTVDGLPPRLKKVITKGDPTSFIKNGGTGRSEMVWYITCSLIRQGWPDDLIIALLTDKSLACTAHVFDQGSPQQYAVEQVRKAKIAVEADWRRTDKGQIVNTSQSNIKLALRKLGARFGHNVFTNRSFVNGVGPLRSLDDHEIIKLRLTVDSSYDFLPNKELFFDIVTTVARETEYNPVGAFLSKNETTWDGVRRLGDAETQSWLTTYGGAEDNAYTRAVGRLTLLAGVRRIRMPGCKHDEMLVLISAQQGTNKSSALAVLAVDPEWFSDSFPLHARDKEVVEYLQGKWIIECGELTGIKQTEIEEIKSLLSRQVDHARMSYARLAEDYPRQCLVIGTTNKTEFLRDLQNRRFWPITIIEFDLDALKRDVLQLWAEAAVAESSGESIMLARELWPAAAEAQDHHKIEDPWMDEIANALGNLEGRILGEEIYKILKKPVPFRQNVDAGRIGDVMRAMGWKRKQFRFPGYPKPKHGYFNGNDKVTLYVSVDENTGDVYVSTAPEVGSYESRPEPPNAAQMPDDGRTPPF